MTPVSVLPIGKNKMGLTQFAMENPMAAFWLGMFGIFMFCLLANSVFVKLPNRVLRHLNIRKHGWPPPHCDADGDFRETEEEDS